MVFRNGYYNHSVYDCNDANDDSNFPERMRIDSSGNVLVGKTASTVNTVGGQIEAGGQGGFTVTSDAAIVANRKSTDGTVISIRKDDSTVGSIGSYASYTNFGTSDVGLMFNTSAQAVIPHNMSTNAPRDNALNLGQGGYRWKDLYLSGGVYLGGTGSANKLDDYEEGTWTPANSGTAFATAYGSYTKIGDRVFCQFKVIAGSGSTSGDWSGLPFTIRSAYDSNLGTGGGSVSYNNSETSTSWQVSCENVNTTAWSLRAGSGQKQLTSGKQCWGAFTYLV